jgi:hypothetical protein
MGPTTGVEAVVVGTLRFGRRELHVECELIRLSDRRRLATTGGDLAGPASGSSSRAREPGPPGAGSP